MARRSNSFLLTLSFAFALGASPVCAAQVQAPQAQNAQNAQNSQNSQTLAEQASDPANEQHAVLRLRALDKITARITEIDLPVGEEGHFGTLALKALHCRTRPPIEPPETFAYLEIDDIKRGGARARVFEGWMVASSPALNALEHPVYDVWVISCKTASPESQSETE